VQIHAFTITGGCISDAVQLALADLTDLVLLTSIVASSTMFDISLEIDTSIGTSDLIIWTSQLAFAFDTDLEMVFFAYCAALTAIIVIAL
jgi:hypothetical protein